MRPNLMIAVPDEFLGKQVEIRADAIVLTSQLIESSDTVLAVDATNLNDGVYSMSLFDVAAAESSAGFVLTIDRTSPVEIEMPMINTTVGVAELVDLQHPEEGTGGFAYEADPGNALLTIDRSSGEINLLPLSATTTPSSVNIMFVDAAGNETTQSFTYEVAENPDPILNLLGFANENGVEFFFDDSVGSDDLQRELGPEGLKLLQVGDNSELSAVSFPAIRFDGHVAENVRSIEDIATFIGFDLSIEQPFVLQDMAIPTATTKIVPLGARDADNVTASSDDPSVMRMSIAGIHIYISMSRAMERWSLRFFESHVPQLARHLANLVESGYYDGLEIYRVNDDLIQAGDPTNLGISAASPNSVDDQFHPHLRHAQSGMLSMAKLVDDGIGGNFFITSRAIPEFDFHYSIVGQIVDGEEVQAAIESAQTVVGGFPKEPIVISSASISADPSRATLFVAANDSVVDTTITLTDGNGSQTVAVAVDRNVNNSGPFIEHFEDIRELGTGVGLVGARDVEGEPIRYHASVADDSGAAVRIDDGWIHVDAPKGFIGTIEVDVSVSSAAGALQVDRFDRQRVSIEVRSRCKRRW